MKTLACDICKGEKHLLDTRTHMSLKDDFYPGFELSIEDDTLTVVSVSDVYEPSYMETDLKINFCPMCGDKLSKE